MPHTIVEGRLSSDCILDLADLVALEVRVGPRWPGKGWAGYRDLAARLRGQGLSVTLLRQRPRLGDYIRDINRCGVLVCGDTLAMHVGLGLGKRVVGLFNCTSPWEIFGYGRLVKIVHPRLAERFYRTDVPPASLRDVPVDAVLRAVRRLASA